MTLKIFLFFIDEFTLYQEYLMKFGMMKTKLTNYHKTSGNIMRLNKIDHIIAVIYCINLGG